MRLRDTVTGEEVDVPPQYLIEPGAEYNWHDGNFACDCNRALLLARWLGQREPDDPPCGESRYEILDEPDPWLA